MDKIKIGGIEYKVKYVKPSEIDEDRAGGGLCDKTKDTLFINDQHTKDNKEIAILHEIFHCLNGELSEIVVDFLAVGFHQVLKENPINFYEKKK